MVSAAMIAIAAREGQVAAHRHAVFRPMGGGVAIAGLFTFVAGRAFGQLVAALFLH